MGKAAGAAWSLAVGLLGSLIVLLPFGWPPWLAALVGLVITVAVALTLTLLERRKRSAQTPPPDPPRPAAIRMRNVRGVKSRGNLFIGHDTAWDAENVEDWDQGEDVIIAPPPKDG
jgi:hypothetical protein